MQEIVIESFVIPCLGWSSLLELVGDVHIEVLYGMELNDLLHCGTEGGQWPDGHGAGDRWSWTEMFGSQVANETLVGGMASGDLGVNVSGEQHSGRMWKMMEKEPYPCGMWEYFLPRKKQSKEVSRAG